MNSPVKLSLRARRFPLCFKGLCSAAAVSTLLLAGSSAFAADGTWNVDANGNFVDSANWLNGIVPGTAGGTTTNNPDTAIFPLSAVTAVRTVTVDTGRNLANITFDDTSAVTTARGYTLAGGTTLLLSAGGTIQTTGTATFTTGINFTDTVGPSLTLEGNYTFADNATNGTTTSTTLLVIGTSTTAGGTVAPAAGLGTVTLTLGGSANTANSNGYVGAVIADGTGTVLSVVKTGTSTWNLNRVNTFTGGLTIQQGVINVGVSGASLGASAATLGSATAGLDATISLGSNFTQSNAINVASGAGARNLFNGGNSNPATFSGAITLNNPTNGLTVGSNSTTAARQLTFSGGITGTGNISVVNSSVNNTVFSTNPINNVGTITNNSTGSGGIIQTTGGTIGTNVTGFVQNSATSVTTFSLVNSYGTTAVNAGMLTVVTGGTLGTGAVTVSSGGTLVTSGTGTLGLGTRVTIAGTGTLTLGNSGALTSAQTLTFAETSTITLGTGTNNSVATIVDSQNPSVVLNPGTYTAAQLDAAFETTPINTFTGSGTLTVTAIPEPATWVGLVLAGMCGFALRRRVSARLA